MSIDLPELILEAGLNPTDYVTTARFVGSVQFNASVAREANLLVGYDPREDNPYHGEVWGAARPNRFSRSQQRALMANSIWLVPIANVELIP